MVDNLDNGNIYIYKYDKELSPKTMYKLWLFIIRSSSMVNLEVMTNIQCYIFVRTTVLYHIINPKKIFPATMLEYMIIQNSSVTVIYMEAISNIKCQLHHLHLE